MKAMILAAGRGQRMRPLTDTTPKPLLNVGGKPLIVWHIERLAATGFNDIIINHAWLGKQIETTLGSGHQWGVRIRYSPEPQPLETAGGIAQALPYLGKQPFLVVNSDIWCDWDPSQAPTLAKKITQNNKLAWLLLVNNPEHNPDGDFPTSLLETNNKTDQAKPPTKLTFAGIGIYQAALFDQIAPQQAARLAPLLHQAIAKHQIIGDHYQGNWHDIGTPQRLQQLQQQLAKQKP